MGRVRSKVQVSGGWLCFDGSRKCWGLGGICSGCWQSWMGSQRNFWGPQGTSACCFCCAWLQGWISSSLPGCLGQTRWKTPVFPHVLSVCSTFPSLLSQALNSLSKSLSSLFVCLLRFHNYSCCWESKACSWRPPAQPTGSTEPPLCRDMLAMGKWCESRGSSAFLQTEQIEQGTACSPLL